MGKHSILTETERRALKTLVQRLHLRHGDRIQAVYLFGSKARGDANSDSDMDVLVALTDDDPHLRSSVRRLAAQVSLEYDLLISVRAVGRSQWEELSRYHFPIYRAIRAEGIALTPESA